LTMALGAGSVTPMQMATAYSVFANGGYRINPWLITKITDQRGKSVIESQPPLPNESVRAVDARNAFIMSRLLQEITRSGTAARAQATLKRVDLYGKTGTTNDSIDTWFAGYQPTLAAVVWMGYDTPRSLGDKETGGGLSLPVWIAFMEAALKGVPVMEPTAPQGVVNVGGEWYFEEFARGGGVGNVGGTSLPESGATVPAVPRAPEDKSLMNSDGLPPSRPQTSPSDERRSILDLFRN
ncbi:MAG: penicillin-binding transpeptidase domain-containing protein, partial [Ramlibacter sp.]